MRKVLIGLLLATASLIVAAQPVFGAKSVVVIDADTHSVLMQKNNGDIKSIASITKMMTAIITVDSKLPMDEVLEITDEDVDGTRLRGYPTSTSLAVGTKLTRAEMLHLALMNSQNRAAHALARTYPGGKEMFVALMNVYAEQLGMTNTHFVDPTGLFSANQSTADDLAKMVAFASTFDVIRDFSTSTSYKLTTYYKNKQRVSNFGSTNKLTSNKAWQIIVQKTGFINDAGRCMVMMTTIATRKVIIILLDAADPHERSADATAIKYYLENGEVATKLQVSLLDPVGKSKPAKKSRHKHSA